MGLLGEREREREGERERGSGDVMDYILYTCVCLGGWRSCG